MHKRSGCILVVIIFSPDSQSVGANSDKKLVLEFIYWLWNVIGHYTVRGAEPIMSSSHLVITIFYDSLDLRNYIPYKHKRIIDDDLLYFNHIQ